MHNLRARRAFVIAMACLCATTASASVAAQTIGAPLGWHAVTVLGEFTFGTVPVERPGGKGRYSALVASVQPEPQHQGVLQQSVKADAYRGRRVRLTGHIKTIAEEGHLWMRVDGDSGVACSDYMELRPIRGTTAWQEYEIVLDVPADAHGITFGVMLDGAGELWIDDVALAVVGGDVATTGHAGGLHGERRGVTDIWLDGPNVSVNREPRSLPQAAYDEAPTAPRNLDFETEKDAANRAHAATSL